MRSGRLRRAFPDAVTCRCFAFEPSGAQMEQPIADMPHLMVFLPGAPKFARHL